MANRSGGGRFGGARPVSNSGEADTAESGGHRPPPVSRHCRSARSVAAERARRRGAVDRRRGHGSRSDGQSAGRLWLPHPAARRRRRHAGHRRLQRHPRPRHGGRAQPPENLRRRSGRARFRVVAGHASPADVRGPLSLARGKRVRFRHRPPPRLDRALPNRGKRLGSRIGRSGPALPPRPRPA